MSGQGGCVHCSLISSSQDDHQVQDLLPLTTFLLPGLYLLVLGLRWGTVCLSSWVQEARRERYHLAGLPPPPVYPLLPHFPWEGVIKILLAVLASILTGSLPCSLPHSQTLVINIYLFFFLSGTTDLLVFYCGYSLLPEGIQSFILSTSFAVEGLTYYSLMTPASSHSLLLLLLTVFSCSLTAALETVFEARLLKFCRSYMTLVQGCWLVLIHSLTGREAQSELWISILFTWTAAGIFLLCLLLMIITQKCCRPSLLHPPKQRSVYLILDVILVSS